MITLIRIAAHPGIAAAIVRRLNVDSIYANCDSLRDSVRADFGVVDIPTPSRP
jgi:hypothetical protein